MLETERLTIRPFQKEDAQDLQEILGDRETMKFSESPYDSEKTTCFLLDFCIGKSGALAAVHKESGKLIGYLLFHELEPGVFEIGWFFNRRFWRNGYAFEACQAVIRDAFVNKNAHKVFAETLDTERSVPLMQKLGMRLEGIHRKQVRDFSGNWGDLYFFGLLREEWSDRSIT